MATTSKITRIQGIQTATDTTTTPADLFNMPGFRASSVNTPLFICTVKPCKSYFESREAWLQHRKVAHPNIPLDASQVATYSDVLATLLPARSRPQSSAAWSSTAPQMPPPNPYSNPMHSQNMTMRPYGVLPVMHPQMMPMQSIPPQMSQPQHTQLAQHPQHPSHMQYQDYDKDMYNQPYLQQYQNPYQHQHPYQHQAYSYNQYQYKQGYHR